MSYDSTDDTKAHIDDVQELMEEIVGDLRYRSALHDQSKLEEPEKSLYDEFTPKLRDMTYGTAKYKATLADMGEALQHHYRHNPHHPEHYDDGIAGMSLLDLIEMLADWTASIKRGKDGNLLRSLAINQERFGYTDELRQILENTVRELGW